MKRILTFTALLCLCVSHLLAQMTYTYPDENGTSWDFTVSGNNEACITGVWLPTAGASEITIPNKVKYWFFDAYGEGQEIYCTVTGIGDIETWSVYGDYRENFQKVIIPSSVKRIGKNAFCGCKSLTTVDLSNCTYIGIDAFYGCESLVSVDLSNCLSVDIRAFFGCSALLTLELPRCESVGASAFSGCTSLTSIDLPNCVELLGDEATAGAFVGCISLTSINLPKCEILGGFTFWGCCALTAIHIPNCKSIGNGAFMDCAGLTSVDLGLCTNIGGNIFSSMINEDGLVGIKEVILHSTTPPTMTGFHCLGKYPIIRIPASALSAYQNAPIWCEPEMQNRLVTHNDIIDYNVTNTALSGEPGLGRVIDRDDMLKVVTLKVSGTINSYDIIAMNNKMINLRWLDLTDATIVGCSHEYYTGYSTIDNVVGNRMFYDHDKYVSIKLPNNTARIDNEAFAGCNNLKDVSLYEGVKSIGGFAFAFCI